MSIWLETCVYAAGIVLILAVFVSGSVRVFAHVSNKPCRTLTVEELEEIWNA